MSPIVPFTSFGLVESVWLIGGVFSALKAFRLSRRPLAEESDQASEPPPKDESADSPADRAPIPIRPSMASTPVPAPTSPVIPSPPASSPDNLGLQILVAEDNPINRKVMQLLLRRMGYEADVAIDGQQAVEMAMAKPYDAILMDLHMPRMGGIEATEAIVAQLSPSPRVVAVTADVTQQARDECHRVGMAAYLTKPVDSNLLLNELKEAEAHRAALGRTG